MEGIIKCADPEQGSATLKPKWLVGSFLLLVQIMAAQRWVWFQARPCPDDPGSASLMVGCLVWQCDGRPDPDSASLVFDPVSKKPWSCGAAHRLRRHVWWPVGSCGGRLRRDEGWGHGKCKDTASMRRRLRICLRDCVARLESSDDQCERLPRRMLES